MRAHSDHRPTAARLRSAALALLGTLLLGACTDTVNSQPADVPADQVLAQDLPEGTVLLVEGMPITREDIDRWLPIYSMFEPTKSQHAIRRYILTNYCLPVTVGAVLDPDGREQARKRLEATLRSLQKGEPAPAEGPQVQLIQGNFKTDAMGLDRWGMAKLTPDGEWSEAFETLGGFTAVRLLAAPETWLPNSEIAIEHITVDYIPATESREFVTEALKGVNIQVIDPEWQRYLPTLYLHNSKLPQ